MTDAIRDKNYKPVMLGQDSTDPTRTLPILINPITGRVLIEILGGGKSIASIVLTSTVGLVDTYTITYSDLSTSTFDVTNGANGLNWRGEFVTGESINQNSTDQSNDFGSTWQLGQSFTPANNIAVKTITVYLSIFGVNTITGNIYAVDGSGFPTGASLGSTTQGDAASTTLTFVTPVNLSAGVQYCFVITSNGGTTSSNSMRSNSTSVYAGGNGIRSINSGSSWAALTGDFQFIIDSDNVSYAVDDAVQYEGSSYINIQADSTGILPTDTAYWDLLAEKGLDGDVVGPASSTDNAIVRFDSITGKLLQNSVVTISDIGDITGGKYNSVAISGASLPTLLVTGTTEVSGINTGNQNMFSVIAVAGQNNISPDSTTDTLTLVAGTNITITTDDTTDTITIAAAGGFAWNATASGTTGTGVALTMSNTYAAAGIGQSITIGNTQSNALVGLKIDTGTSAVAQVGMLINSYNVSTTAYGISIDPSTTCTGAGINFANTGGTGFIGIKWGTVNSAANTKYAISITTLNNNTSTTYGLFISTVQNGASGNGYGVFFNTLNSNNGGTGYGVYTATISGGQAAYFLYAAQIGSATVGNLGRYFSFNNSQSSATLQARTNDASEILFARTGTHVTGTIADNFSIMNLKRTSVQNGAGGTFTTTGSVLRLENVATQTAGTLTDTVACLSLVQSNNSTGGHILFNAYSGVPLVDGTMYFDGTNYKCRVGGVTKTFTIV